MFGEGDAPMPESEAQPKQQPSQRMSWPALGVIAFILLGVAGALGPDITPNEKLPDPADYIPRYVLLALSVGFALHAVRSKQRVDRVFAIAVLVVGVGMVAYIIRECLRITNR
jgi:hypothetical protein